MTDTPKTPVKVTSGPISPPAADPLQELRDREAQLLRERNELLEAENAELKARRRNLQQDPKSRAIAAQMQTLDEEARTGTIHISEFAKANVAYKGKEEDLTALRDAQEA